MSEYQVASLYDGNKFCGLVGVPKEVYENQRGWDGIVFSAYIDGATINVALDGSSYGLWESGTGDPIVRAV